jgi:hypothetical protein
MSEKENIVYQLESMPGFPQKFIMRCGGVSNPSDVECLVLERRVGDMPKLDTSGKIIRYITSDNDGEQAYKKPVPVGDWDWIDFLLFDGDILLDRSRVPVIESENLDPPRVGIFSGAPS